MLRDARPQVCSALQLNNAIPVLLRIRDNTEAAPQIQEEIKGLREDIQPGYANHFRQMQADVKAIKERLGMSRERQESTQALAGGRAQDHHYGGIGTKR